MKFPYDIKVLNSFAREIRSRDRRHGKELHVLQKQDIIFRYMFKLRYIFIRCIFMYAYILRNILQST